MTISIQRKTPSRLLNPASGYLTGYTHTLNPYSGCAFACAYCYVREMPVAKFRQTPWGDWVDIKDQAAPLLRKELGRAAAKGPVSIFMASSTDPYQPAEYSAQVTRSLLEVMADMPEPAFLLLQTRSPLVLRDEDLLRRLGRRVRVSLTVETDLEPVRRAFTPYAPPLAARLRTLRRLTEAGVPVQAAIAPLLPSTPQLAERLASAGVERIVVDDYFMGDGSQGKRTGRMQLRPIYERLGFADWYDPAAYLRVLEHLQPWFRPDQIFISQAGFLP